jgi:hypothetical protein
MKALMQGLLMVHPMRLGAPFVVLHPLASLLGGRSAYELLLISIRSRP